MSPRVLDSIAVSDDRIYLLESSPPRVPVYDMDGTHTMSLDAFPGGWTRRARSSRKASTIPAPAR